MTSEDRKFMIQLAKSLEAATAELKQLGQRLFEQGEVIAKITAGGTATPAAPASGGIATRLEHDGPERGFDIRVVFEGAKEMPDQQRKETQISFAREFVALCEDYHVQSLRGTYVRISQ